METIVCKIDENNFIVEELKQAAEFLRHGKLVAFPTETVYGLGANGLDKEAAKKIYAAKGRPSDNPLIIHIADIGSLKILTKKIPENAKKLADAFWPGPLTMIFEKSDVVPLGTTGGLNTVAIRMPVHKVALELIRQSGVYVAAPSANTSGKPSPTTAKHVIDDLAGTIDMVVDGGDVGIGLESTIVDVTSDIPTILRPGYITKAMLEGVVGEVTIDKAILGKQMDTNLKPKAPGMKYKHYAPKGDLTIFEGDINKVITTINEIAKEKIDQGYRVGIIATDETKNLYPYGTVVSIGTRKNEDTIAHSLYGVLRDFDDMNIEFIYTESFSDDDLGQAIMNRLLKAAGYQIISL